MPNAKELQSILDYSRSPNSTNSAAIDSLFECTQITNEDGVMDYPYYWSSTTHANWTTDHDGAWGVYLAFGRGLGYDQMGPMPGWIDVHGAGTQRSDPKLGDPSEYPTGHGPQGDAVRIYNFVRLVRGGETTTAAIDLNYNYKSLSIYPIPAQNEIFLSSDDELTTVSFHNLKGQKVLENHVNQQKISINTSQLANGMYFIKAITNKNNIAVQKILIEH